MEKLPINISTNDILKLNKKVVKARENIREFEIRLLENKLNNALFHLFTKKEAQQSTKIEGTQSTFNEVIEAKITKNHTDDVIEVLNYLKALNYGVEQLNNLPISTRLIQGIHREMLRSGRGKNTNIGNYRTIQNWIGANDIKNAIYIPPIPNEIDKYMSNLEEYINDNNDDLDDLIKIAIIHAQFETIHPFIDGNGRVGRILIILYLISKGVIKNINLYLSEELELKKLKYYSYLSGTRKEKPEWVEWIDFFLDCVIEQTRKNIEKIKSIDILYNNVLTILKKDNLKYQYVEYIFQNPILNIKECSKDLGVSYVTAKKNIEKLVNNKILYSEEERRNKKYYFLDLLDKFR